MAVARNIDADKFPKQGPRLNKRVKVCFNYDTRRTFGATCIRDDLEEPMRTVFLLDDGRVVLSTECQYTDT